MKYVQIHSDSYSWFKSIIYDKHLDMLREGIDSYVAWGRGRKPGHTLGQSGQPREFRIGNRLSLYRDALLTRLDDRDGFHSWQETKRLIDWLDAINPDIVHLHQLHGYYINIELLFAWLSEHRCKVKWTLHDCWAFTGHCVYFTYANCLQWKSHCAYEEPCSQLSTYPKTFSSTNCSRNFDDKKRIFTSIPPKRMTLITPSCWLENLVKESFLNGYPIMVKYNTVDKTIFKPTSSDFREKYGIGDRFMILGVASPWTERKGLRVFVELGQLLGSEKYAVVLVGLNRAQIKAMPPEIIALPRTENSISLAKIYTAANLFINPSIEETFGMTVAESVACGTAVAVVEDSACEEAAKGGERYTLKPDLSNLLQIIDNCSLTTS